MPPTYPLRPVNPNNACPLRITAAAGTELAGASFQGTVRHRMYYPLCFSSQVTELYDPKAFIAHAASLRQGFPHCERFSTAASRRSLGSVSVPVWLTILSDQLLILALVGSYPTNKLIRLGPISEQKLINRGQFLPHLPQKMWSYLVLASLSRSYPSLRGKLPKYSSPSRHSHHRCFNRSINSYGSRSTCMPNPRRQRSF